MPIATTLWHPMITEFMTIYSKEINTKKNINTPDNLLQDIWINVDLSSAINTD